MLLTGEPCAWTGRTHCTPHNAVGEVAFIYGETISFYSTLLSVKGCQGMFCDSDLSHGLVATAPTINSQVLYSITRITGEISIWKEDKDS